jgi:serine/threonine protein kinase/Tfp pilus assembly protein PilF
MNNATLDSATDELMGQIVDDYVERLGRGESPDIEDYARRHPELASVVRQMLPALALVHASSAGARTPQDELQPEGPLGDFRLVREVGRGGMGVVYEASQISLGRTVALKVLPFAGAMDKRQLQRFQNEARAAASLEHPHIVPIYAVGCERGVHFYAMKFIDGASLETLLQEMRPPQKPAAPDKTNDADATGAGPQCPDDQAERETVREPRGQASTLPAPGDKRAYFRRVAELGVEAARGLEHAHEVGVMHRDIKPANLLLDGHGKVWITDFGLAQIRADTRLTMTGDLVGTLRYMSPEQALAKRVIVDHRTDIYSLGATLYELLTLAPVYDGGDRHELLRQIAFEEPKSTRRHNPAIPLELDTIILKAIEKNPADRYATAKEMADDLQRFLEGEPIRARPPSVARRLRGWCRRHVSLAVGLGVFVATALLLGGSVFLRQEWQGAAIARAVNKDLDEAEFWQRQEQWDKALHVLERAAARLEERGPEDLRAQLEIRRRNADVVVRLEKLRVQTSLMWFRSDPVAAGEYAAADLEFTEAFAALGLNPSDPAEEVARRIRVSPISSHLLTALDDWAYVKGRLPKGGGKALQIIAGLADDDRWRMQLRNARLPEDRELLVRLSEGDEALSQPSAYRILLTSLLNKARAREAATRFLRRAQARQPADFWNNYALARQLYGQASEREEPIKPFSFYQKLASDALGFYRAALALQPQNPEFHEMIGHVLHEFYSTTDLPEAEAAHRKAIELRPGRSWSHYQLGLVLADQRRYAEADDAYRTAIELEPGMHHAVLGRVNLLTLQKKWPEAEKFLRQMLQDGASSDWRSRLVQVLREQNRLSEAEAELRLGISLDPPGSGDFYIPLAEVLHSRHRYQDAVATCRQVIDLRGPQYFALYSCARVAARCGDSAEAIKLDAMELSEFRKQALAWLRAALIQQQTNLDTEPVKKGPTVRSYMRNWQQEAAFKAVRGEKALAKLPEAERMEWRKLWDDVAALEKRAAGVQPP